MPLDYGFRFDYNKIVLPVLADLRQPGEQEPVGFLELWFWHCSMQNDELLFEQKYLKRQLLSALEAAGDRFQDTEDGLNHS